MKANQFAKDDHAQVGIGTMIVFIATVLVAAVAAGVLISVGGDLQSQSKATGEDASQEVANSLSLKRAYARDVTGAGTDAEADSDGDDDVGDELHLYVALASGASPIDFSDVEILLDTGSSVTTLVFADITGVGGAPPAGAGTYFTVERAGALSADSELSGNDIVNVRLLGEYAAGTNYGARLNIAPGSDVGVTMVLPNGSPLSIELSMPKVMDEDFEQLY